MRPTTPPTPPTPHIWWIELLGGLRAVCGDRSISRFRTEKTASLFAFLAFHPERTSSREFLAELFWPDVDPNSARHSLRLALSSLRQQFSTTDPSAPLLLTDRRTARLDPSRFQTDVLAFEAALASARGELDLQQRTVLLDRAVELYSGELLHGFYDSWIGPHQFRLQQAFLNAAVDLAACHERLGDPQRAAAAAARAVSEDPLCEEAQLMRLRLALKGGSPSAAAGVFQEIESNWRDLLGEPLPDSIRMLASRLPKQAAMPPSDPRSRGRTGSRTSTSDTLIATNSPPESTHKSARFIGRREEVAALVDMLQRIPSAASSPGPRLVTLTGPGGSGKTRLAEEMFDRLSPPFAGASWMVRLGELQDPALLASAMQFAMKLPSVKDVPPLEAIQRTLSEKPAFLVLDNFEQLLPDGAATLQDILLAAPQLTCVVTSRRSTGLPHEREFPVLPLPTPTGRESLELLQRVPSVELFVERAQRARPDFLLSSKNAPEVAELCSRLEGMPLAIELAAARAYALSPAQMLSKLSDRYELLSGRDTALDARHRTMRAAVACSYDLLTADARTLFRRLSVFRGGWTMDAAAAVSGSTETGALLEELRASSLLFHSSGRDPERFDMLDTLREYADFQLTMDERESACRRHLAFFAQFAREGSPHLTGPLHAEYMSRFSADLANFRAALELAEHVDPASGLRITAGIWRVWLAQGHLSEGRMWIARLLNLEAPVPFDVRASALFGAGVLAAEQSDYTAARGLFEACLHIAQEIADRLREGAVLNALGNVARELGDQGSARACYDASLAVSRSIGDLTGVAATLTNLSNVLHYQGHFEAAAQLAQEGLTMRREAGHPYGEAACVEILGICSRALGDFEQAERLHREALAINTRLGSKHGVAGSLHNLAAAEFQLGRRGEAREHVLNALEMNRDLGHTAWEAYNLNLLAAMALQERDTESAIRFARESLVIRRRLNELRDVAVSVERFGSIAAAVQDPVRAARLLGAAESLRRAAGAGIFADETADREAALRIVRTALGATACDQEIARGAAMSLEEAIEAALQI